MQCELYIPKIPGPRVPETILITILLGVCGLDCHLGEVDQFVDY